MLQLTDGAGHLSTRAYDAAGNQITLTNRNGKKWQFQFDGANRLTNTITPRGYSTSLSFNHQGLVNSIKDQANQPTSVYYDAKGRLTNRTDNVATTLYGFDANGNRTSATENGQTNSWTYDAYNRASSYKDIYGNLIQYRYDANGNVTNLIYPGGKNVYYAYDSLNRMTNVTDWAGRKSAMTYDLNSHITGITRPNGSYRTISYDAAGQATNIYEQMSNSLPIAIFKYNWTNSGNMAWEFAAPLPHTATVPTRTMTYDDDNRLASVDGNNVTVDLDGNLTSGPLTNDTFAAYTYDARNRLLNAGGVTNAYDAINNRIGQTYGTNTTIFVVNPNTKLPQVLMRIKNGVTNYYIYGDGLLYQVTETATATNTLTYHYDYRGSTIALSADNGLVTDRIEYSAYGLTTYRAGVNDTPFLFNGRYGVQTDPNGLLYMQARYYNPYLCRFLNPDPTGFKGGLNMFAAFNGNPVSYLDPFGLNAGTTGDSSWTWMGLYNSIASAVVPGQVAWNNAMSAWQAGNYGTAAMDTANMIGQQALFVLTLGGSSAATPTLNAAESETIQLTSGAQQTLAGTQNGILIGTVENGQVNLFETAAGQIEGHSDLLGQGLISPGAQGFSIGVVNGQVTTIFQNSILNPASANYLLPAQTTQQILNALGATGARLFP
jgi:RHS repeat-associated protein